MPNRHMRVANSCFADPRTCTPVKHAKKAFQIGSSASYTFVPSGTCNGTVHSRSRSRRRRRLSCSSAAASPPCRSSAACHVITYWFVVTYWTLCRLCLYNSVGPQQPLFRPEGRHRHVGYCDMPDQVNLFVIVSGLPIRVCARRLGPRQRVRPSPNGAFVKVDLQPKEIDPRSYLSSSNPVDVDPLLGVPSSQSQIAPRNGTLMVASKESTKNTTKTKPGRRSHNYIGHNYNTARQPKRNLADVAPANPWSLPSLRSDL